MEPFWHYLPRPFFVMAPMADVTDPAWRSLVASLGKPDVTWTEFVSADGLYHTRQMQKLPDEENPLMRDLRFSEGEHPIVAQFFTANPHMMSYVATLAEELGFDGVDINMGCPDRGIEGQGAGAAIIKTPALAKDIIRAAKESTRLPISVKTRIGYNQNELDSWLPVLLEAKPAAVTLHLRTRKEMSLVGAHWEQMRRAVAIRNEIAPDVFLIGNGDVVSREEGMQKSVETGADGIMIGRGMFGNPWVFAGRTPEDVPLSEKLVALTQLAYEFEKLTPPKHFAILKKHIKAFVTGFDGASRVRERLMEAEHASDLEARIKEIPLS